MTLATPRPLEAPDCRGTALADPIRHIVCYNCGHDATFNSDGTPGALDRNCPICSLGGMLEYRYYTDEWRKAFAEAKRRRDAASKARAAAQADLDRLWQESMRPPEVQREGDARDGA